MFLMMDSNIYIADFKLQSSGYKVLFENSQRLGIKLFASQVVIDEVEQNYKERLSDFSEEIKKFNNIVASEHQIPDINIDPLLKQFEKGFEKQISDFNNITTRIVPVTETNFWAVYKNGNNQ